MIKVKVTKSPVLLGILSWINTHVYKIMAFNEILVDIHVGNFCKSHHSQQAISKNIISISILNVWLPHLHFGICPSGNFNNHVADCFLQFKMKYIKKTNDLVHINTVSLIHLEVGSIKSRDPHSQKPASLPDKRASPIQHFSSFPVQNALLHSWNICSFVTRQFPQNQFPGSSVKDLEVKKSSQMSWHFFRSVSGEKI